MADPVRSEKEFPATALANDGETVLRRYRVDGVIYARNIAEARSRLRETVPLYLDGAVIRRPRKRGT